jgi:hypothetical protein
MRRSYVVYVKTNHIQSLTLTRIVEFNHVQGSAERADIFAQILIQLL